jgi:hypothetical protein
MFDQLAALEVGAEGWNPGSSGYPSAARISWALLGGAAGAAWLREKRALIQRAKEIHMKSETEGVLAANAHGVLLGDVVKWEQGGLRRTGVVEHLCEDSESDVQVPGTDHVLTVQKDDAVALIELYEHGQPTGKIVGRFCSQVTRGLTRDVHQGLIEKRADAVADSVDEEKRVVRFVASDGGTDRYGDVIDQDGWDLRAFKRNPILLWMHNHAIGPIGKIVVKGDDALAVKDGKLLATAEFADEGLSEPVERLRLWKQVKAGLLRAFSISARPTVPPEMIRDKSDQPTGGYLYRKLELLEISLVSVPANPRALAVARSFGLTDAEINQVFDVGASAENLKTYQTGLVTQVRGLQMPRQA